MAENERTPDCENGAALKEAVCIDAMRIYDSCSDKDCLEDLRVLFPASVQPVVDASANVRVRDVDVISVYIDMQPIPFNRGYYSIDLTFFFDVSLELYGGATVGCERVSGISIFNKKVILYGRKDDYASGVPIISDRYVTSNIVYQLSKLPKTEWKAFVSWLEDLEYEKFGLPRPDRVIYLDVPPKISQRLLTERYAGDTTKKDIHESDIHYLLHCRDCALYAAEHLNWTVLNCAEGDTLRSIEDIHHEIKKKLEDLL